MRPTVRLVFEFSDQIVNAEVAVQAVGSRSVMRRRLENRPTPETLPTAFQTASTHGFRNHVMAHLRRHVPPVSNHGSTRILLVLGVFHVRAVRTHPRRHHDTHRRLQLIHLPPSKLVLIKELVHGDGF